MCINWHSETWFEQAILGMENHPAFLEKQMMEEMADHEPFAVSPLHRTEREHAYVRNRKHKKKLFRRFFDLNPAMDFINSWAFRTHDRILLLAAGYSTNEGRFIDSLCKYSINPFTNVFRSKRGDLRIYRGLILKDREAITISGSFKRENSKITNRRIRSLPPIEETEGMRYPYLKKLCSMDSDRLW